MMNATVEAGLFISYKVGLQLADNTLFITYNSWESLLFLLS